jgi:transposase
VETGYGHEAELCDDAPAKQPFGHQPQKKTLSASEQDPLARLLWLAEVLKCDPKRLVFIDESGFNLALAPLYARAPKGQRAYGQVPKNRGENSSLIAALSLDEGISAAMTVEGAVDGIAFNVYVQHVLAPTLRAGQLVVLDNLQVHKNQAVRQAIEGCGCEVLFLPSYSPDFNPIEHAFSKLKALVRKHHARTKQALDDAIAAALKAITLQDVIGWFSHAGYLPHGF